MQVHRQPTAIRMTEGITNTLIMMCLDIKMPEKGKINNPPTNQQTSDELRGITLRLHLNSALLI